MRLPVLPPFSFRNASSMPIAVPVKATVAILPVFSAIPAFVGRRWAESESGIRAKAWKSRAKLRNEAGSSLLYVSPISTKAVARAGFQCPCPQTVAELFEKVRLMAKAAPLTGLRS